MTAGGRVSASALLACAIVLGAGVGGFLLHRLTKPEGETLRAVAASPPSTAAAQATAAAPAPATATPEQLPEISLPDVAGRPHRLSEWRGRPLFINFWATWCEPCRREIPLLKSLRMENAKTRLEIVGIALDQQQSVQEFVQKLGIEYPVLVGEKGGLEAVSAFGMDTVLPFTVVADSEGRIVTIKVGELHRDEATFILARLADLSAGRIDLAAAREQIGAETRRLARQRAGSGGPGG
ncbi:MAG TPA: TlpA disulfide reductase family protein [Steroidobacteraceae bacterium]|nr:TlpA disulfide reductase family protein [Steroidobacteraceae bacterium]